MVIGFTNGCFDLFHYGHLYLLREAKKLCDELHVGMNSDISIMNLKGVDRPIIPQEQRYEILSAIKYIDYLYTFDDLTPINLIRDIMPDIIIKGSDWDPMSVVGKNIVRTVMTIPRLPDISTTNIIDSIRSY